ncbi:hypothetical protein [Ktedonobacter sp. SOSP1-52]|uniref:hypothetical protein n=1 Tax=Ktedonobacter sp. SOSP1-52 TaxID=2778366 RepID=UPI00191619B2|nr:hypothetical protein [Ktedonobacter sp. SOSP1-52]
MIAGHASHSQHQVAGVIASAASRSWIALWWVGSLQLAGGLLASSGVSCIDTSLFRSRSVVSVVYLSLVVLLARSVYATGVTV